MKKLPKPISEFQPIPKVLLKIKKWSFLSIVLCRGDLDSRVRCFLNLYRIFFPGINLWTWEEITILWTSTQRKYMKIRRTFYLSGFSKTKTKSHSHRVLKIRDKIWGRMKSLCIEPASPRRFRILRGKEENCSRKKEKGSKESIHKKIVGWLINWFWGWTSALGDKYVKSNIWVGIDRAFYWDYDHQASSRYP